MEVGEVTICGHFKVVQLSELDFPGHPYSASVLKAGYCLPQTEGTFRADGSITLVTGPKNILVDTGGPWDRDFLLLKLKEKDLGPGDVHVVVGTHGHSDHVGNLNLFPKALIIVGYDISEGDTYHSNRLAEGQAFTIDEHVRCGNLQTFTHTRARRQTDTVRDLCNIVYRSNWILEEAT